MLLNVSAAMKKKDETPSSGDPKVALLGVRSIRRLPIMAACATAPNDQHSNTPNSYCRGLYINLYRMDKALFYWLIVNAWDTQELLTQFKYMSPTLYSLPIVKSVVMES